MAEKAWRRPGSDISDWFNYGFDEISWEAYCYRRRDLGEMANVLKTNVLVGISKIECGLRMTDSGTNLRTSLECLKTRLRHFRRKFDKWS